MAKKEEPVDRARKVEELGLARKIMETLSTKADKIVLEARNENSNFRLEPAERVKLLEINNLGMTEGVAAGLLSLVALRRIRATLLRRLWQNQQQANYRAGASRPPPPTPPPSATHNNPFHNNSPFQQAAQQQQTQFNPPPPLTPPPPPPKGMPKQGTFSFILGWLLDVLGAFSVMVTVSFIFTDIHKILDKLSSIPLVEGRSTIAREFCPDIVQALKEMRAKDAAAAAVMDDAQTKQLQAVLKFVENCQRRAAYEANLRREKGVGRHYPVAVPAPGVPADFPINDHGETATDGDSNHNNDSDFYDPRQEEGTEEWADIFTEDRKS